MKLRTWPVLTAGFGILVALIILTGWGALRRARQIYAEISAIHENDRNGDRIFNEVRTEIHLSGLLVRDFLLDRSHLTAESYRSQLREIRSSIPREIEQVKAVLAPQDAPKLDRLRNELDAYWDSLDPLFEWTPEQKLAYSSAFLRRQVLPRRTAALNIAREIRDLNQANVKQQRIQLEAKEAELPRYILRMLLVTVLLGLSVTGVSIYRTTRLEHRAERDHRRTELAEKELRRLSHQLVRAQEDERKAISRELHDAIGQMLTAQRMELRNLRALRTAPEEEFVSHLEDSARLSEEALRAVRDLAMGLRPSMLDDIGLAPAIEWQVREFMRRAGVSVDLQMDGVLSDLPDTHRTCIYRVVQEALTNCARHAHATGIRVTVHGGSERITMTIQDNGRGFNTWNSRGKGLGLIGIEERVKELGGHVNVVSQAGKGTIVSAEIPLAREAASA